MTIDTLIPRECVYRTFDDDPGPCPRCGSELASEFAAYLIATKRGRKDTDNFIISGRMGWFCPECPTIVINPASVGQFLQYSKPGWDIGTEFAVLGIIDLDAVPADKRHLPLDHEDVPLHLIEFSGATDEDERPTPRGPSRDEGTFEERYLDVLQNIEFGIIRVYREHPEMTDWQARSAIEALLREYRAEAKGRETRSASLNELSEEVYDSVRMLCEWRLGRAVPHGDDGAPIDLGPEPLTLDEIVDSLKRVRKSINRRTRRGGRQGYLTFVDQYIS